MLKNHTKIIFRLESRPSWNEERKFFRTNDSGPGSSSIHGKSLHIFHRQIKKEQHIYYRYLRFKDKEQV